MKNSKPRFALDDAHGIYDYLSGAYMPAAGTLEENGGSWDLAAVAALIRADQPIEAAFTPGATTGEAHADKVEEAKAAFNRAIDELSAAAPSVPEAAPVDPVSGEAPPSDPGEIEVAALDAPAEPKPAE